MILPVITKPICWVKMLNNMERGFEAYVGVDHLHILMAWSIIMIAWNFMMLAQSIIMFEWCIIMWAKRIIIRQDPSLYGASPSLWTWSIHHAGMVHHYIGKIHDQTRVVCPHVSLVPSSCTWGQFTMQEWHIMRMRSIVMWSHVEVVYNCMGVNYHMALVHHLGGDLLSCKHGFHHVRLV